MILYKHSEREDKCEVTVIESNGVRFSPKKHNFSMETFITYTHTKANIILPFQLLMQHTDL